MEGETLQDNESGAMCIICCCSFIPSNSGGSTSTPVKNIGDKCEGGESSGVFNLHHQFNKFCEVVALQKRSYGGNGDVGDCLPPFQVIKNLMTENQISDQEGRGGGCMSVCQNCLVLISGAVDTKEKVHELERHVRSLQLQILQALRELEIFLKQYDREMGKIRGVIRESDVTCLKIPMEMKMGIIESPSPNVMTQLGNSVLSFRSCILLEDEFSVESNFDGDMWKSRSGEHVQVKLEIIDEGEDEMPLNLEDDWQVEKNDQVGNICPPKRSGLRRRKKISLDPKLEGTPVRTQKKYKKRTSVTGETKKKTISKTMKVLRGRRKSKCVNNKRVKIKITCDLCSYKTAVEPAFEQHLRQHETEVKTLQCPMCPLQFSTNQYFQFHQKSHTGYYSMVCDVCSKRVPSTDLASHLKSHVIDDSQIIFCQNCSFCCASPEAYRKHLRFHLSYKTSGKFICDICSDDLGSHGQLLSHLDQAHGIGEKLFCGIEGCQKYFQTQQKLTHHRNRHSKRNMTTCIECNKVFMSIEGFEAHFRKIHRGEKRFSCDLCPEKFATKIDVGRHKIRRHEAPKHKCSVCETEFADKSYLKLHMRAFHDDKGCKCPHCGKILMTTNQLQRHMISHTEVRNWTCEECGKRFKHSSHLKIHMREHKGIKDHKCSYCGKAFTRKDNLTLHLRTHTGEKPYVCDLCGKGFSQKTPLTVHKRNVHKEVALGQAVGNMTTEPQINIP